MRLIFKPLIDCFDDKQLIRGNEKIIFGIKHIDASSIKNMLFTIIEIFVLIGLLQVLFLLFSLKKIKDRSRYFGKYLIYFLVLNAFMLAGVIRFSFQGLDQFEHWFRGLDTLDFLYGPLVYAIFRQSTADTSFKLKKYHFYPALLGIIILFIINLGIVDNPKLVWFYDFRGVYSATVCLIYWAVANIHLFKVFSKNPKLSIKEEIQKRFLIALSISILPFAVLWFGTSFIQKLGGQEFGIFNFDTVLIVLCVPSYIMSYFSIVYPNIMRKKPKKNSGGLVPLLDTSEIKYLHKMIDDRMRKERSFLNPKLTLNQLASEMNVTPNKLSWYLNNELDTSFYNFINQFRVEEFKSLIKKNEYKTHTIIALAIDSGFNSKSTFNKIFKQFSGQTPSEFVKMQDSE